MIKLKKLTPMLVANDMRETSEFYQNRLGFRVSGTYPDAENPSWMEMEMDGISLMFRSWLMHEDGMKQTIFTGSLYFNTEDVDALWEQLKDKVTVVYPIENFEYGMREFAIEDCNGYLLQFGRELGS